MKRTCITVDLVLLKYIQCCVFSPSAFNNVPVCELICANVSVRAFIHSLYTKCETACLCVWVCVHMRGNSRGSCLVRLITPLSAALGSMCWWIPQQRSSWPETLHGQWLTQCITDAVSFWLCLNKEKGKDRQSMYVFLTKRVSRQKRKKTKTLILYKSCEQSLTLRKAATNRPGFQTGSS